MDVLEEGEMCKWWGTGELIRGFLRIKSLW